MDRLETLNEEYRNEAREIYGVVGVIEVDTNAPVSMSDDEGAYVQAWVWVPENKE